MIIDCESCSVRGDACTDCVISTVLALQRAPVDFDEAEQSAVGALADGGLLPPLRLVPMSSGMQGGMNCRRRTA